MKGFQRTRGFGLGSALLAALVWTSCLGAEADRSGGQGDPERGQGSTEQNAERGSRTPAPIGSAVPTITVDRIELLARLEAGDYAALEATLSEAFSIAREDFSMEPNAQLALATFATSKPEVGDRLRRWTEKRPGSSVARVAYAEHLITRAWKERGTASAPETTAEQFAGMRKYFEMAESELSAALDIDPESLEAHLILHLIARTRGTDKAKRRIERRALEISPASYRLRWGLLYGRTPRWGGSYRELERFAAESQQWAEENPRLRILRGFADWEKGSIAALAKEDEVAIQQFDAAIAAGESTAYYTARSRAKNRTKDPAGALADLDRALELYPQNPETLFLRAKRLGDLGRYDEAFEDLAMGFALDSANADAAHASHYVSRRAVQGAVKLIKRKPKPDLERAEYLLARAEEWEPTDPWLLHDRARLAIARGDLARAEGEYVACTESHPDFFECYRSLDWVLAKRGAWDAIVGHWDRFLAVEPEHAGAYLERAGTHKRRRDRAAALADLQRACDLGSKQACLILRRESGG